MPRIGISVTSLHKVEDHREGARRIIERADAASGAGLDSLFLGDHHAVPVPYYQNVPMLGRLLADWQGPRAGALFLLPLWNPVLVAEQCATLACLYPGRFIMQCGLGAGDAQFAAMSANIRTRPSAFEQSIDVVRKLWAGESVSLDGRWQINEARIAPLPPEPIDIWIGASAPVAIERAARIGDAWLADPGMTLDAAKKSLDIYLEAINRLGRTTPDTIPIRRDVYVAESLKDADKARELAGGYRGMDPSALMIGTVEEVSAQMDAFGQSGYTDIIVRNLHPEHDKAVQSTQRLSGVIENLK